MPSAGAKVTRDTVVERCYVPAPESCESAVALLLRSPADKKKAARPGGPDDAEESQNDRTAEPEYNR
jgi:hypothetical protein